jgi:hypothetical protein
MGPNRQPRVCGACNPDCWPMATDREWAEGCLMGWCEADWVCPFLDASVPKPPKPLLMRVWEILTGQRLHTTLGRVDQKS